MWYLPWLPSFRRNTVDSIPSYPNPLSSFDSITVPSTWPLGSALVSQSSAWAWMASSRASRPSPFRAEISTDCISPPNSSSTTLCFSSSLLILAWSGLIKFNNKIICVCCVQEVSTETKRKGLYKVVGSNVHYGHYLLWIGPKMQNLYLHANISYVYYQT